MGNQSVPESLFLREPGWRGQHVNGEPSLAAGSSLTLLFICVVPSDKASKTREGQLGMGCMLSVE